MSLDLFSIREQFPSLQRPAVFLDNPGGTQITKRAIDRITSYLLMHNANHEGAFATSIESDAVLQEAHVAMADFLNAPSPDEIIFGNNMTTLTLHISRSIARTWQAGDEIVVTRLDHDANITPWVLAAQDRGVNVRWVDFDPEQGVLNLEDMQAALERKPRLVAVGYASNALGTINPVKKITRMAHQAGALVYVDAVQYAPHGPIDVQDLDCDFLVCSSYKFFGPHAGILWGRYHLLDSLTAYKVRPASNRPPGKFETGTQNHEGIAGVLGALEYLEWVGETFGDVYRQDFAERYSGRRLRLKQGMAAIRAYEYEVSHLLLDILEETPGLRLYGLRDPRRLEERVPTFSFTLQGWHPRRLAERLAQSGFYVWDGNYYALAVTERLGLEGSGGMLRVGPVHYNTLEEIQHFGEALGKIAAENE
ncbi:MAG: cysteine desulfurase-like protein [Anaerolineales bacterium]|jgi:cysteine desulfurase family protein (TIGR01976 family)|nr:cysteine desulfurase-like protein [Anaerolineales bacterium]